MPYLKFIWTDEIIAHLAEHDISPWDFEHVMAHPADAGYSRSTGLPAMWGYTPDGRYIMAVYDVIDEVTVEPVTAYEVHEPR